MSLTVVNMGSRPDFLEPIPRFFTSTSSLLTLPYEVCHFAQEEEEVDPWSEEYVAAGGPTYTDCFCESCGYELAATEELFCACCREANAE
jgi:hypothetical protein